MTNDELREIIPDIVRAATDAGLLSNESDPEYYSNDEVRDALLDIIDNEESAWTLLEELKDNEKSMKQQRDIKIKIQMLDN